MKVLTYDEAQLHNTAVALGKFQGLHRGHMLLLNEILDLAKCGPSGILKAIYFFKLIFVTFMKRVVFANNTNGHG